MNNLAQMLHAQGDLAGARKLQEQVLEPRVALEEGFREEKSAREDFLLKWRLHQQRFH